MMLMIPTFIPSIIAAITKAAVTIGPMIAKYAPFVIKTVGENLPKLIQVIEGISLATDILRPNEKIDELGAKAMVADKTPEDFKQINDYIDYLRNEVQIDEAILSKDAIDVSVRQAVGCSIVLKALGNELNTDISLPFLNKVSVLDVEPKAVIEIIKSYSESGLSPDDVEAYINGSLTLEESNQHSNNLINAYHNAYPSMNSEELQQAVMRDF